MKFCVMFPPPPNQNPGVAPEHIYNLVDVIVSYIFKSKFSKHTRTVQKLQSW